MPVVREYTINPGETIKITSAASASAIKVNSAPKPKVNSVPKSAPKPFNPFNSNNNGSVKPANASASVKSKRTLSNAMVKMGENRKVIFEELKRKWAEENPSFVSLNASALKAAVARGEVKKKPVFSNALIEHSRKQREGNPEKEAKHAAYRSKVESARVAKSVPAQAPAAVESKVRKNPWANLTEQQKKNRVAKMHQGKTAKKGYVELPGGPKNAEVVAASANNVEAFKPFTLKGEEYWKNGLNFVYKKTSEGSFGDYVGKYDATKDEIDSTVEEPPVEGGRRKTRKNRK